MFYQKINFEAGFFCYNAFFNGCFMAQLIIYKDIEEKAKKGPASCGTRSFHGAREIS
jgi:hypothetical protein